MREKLAQWLRDADALQHIEQFKLNDRPPRLDELKSRTDDLYITLVGELFEHIRNDYTTPESWARLGNAFGLFVTDLEGSTPWNAAINRSEAALFAAAAFYFGGFPASAYLMVKQAEPVTQSEAHLACFDLLARPEKHHSEVAQHLENFIREGKTNEIKAIVKKTKTEAQEALHIGPEEWISTRLFQKLIEKFETTNIRAVLPDGQSEFWTHLVESFLDRHPRTWDFFPSQIDAINDGLLTSSTTYTLQMPTGAGKTALSEILLYYHLKHDSDAIAVIIVPSRSLASELRGSLVPRLIKMGLPSQCAYGGTVSSGDEIRDVNDTRVLIATPETLSGLLTANPEFYQRISLAICDEGHLLDSNSRGVLLELLLTRMKTREGGAPRFVFISAIVPNSEDINEWLGGSPKTVIQSTYQPTFADFGVLLSPMSTNPKEEKINNHTKDTEKRQQGITHLELYSQEPANNIILENFLTRDDFSYYNINTKKQNTYRSSSKKTQAIAAARKTLPIGTSVVFTANKRGIQGVNVLAEELLKQIKTKVNLPLPLAYSNIAGLTKAVEYMELEYGVDWIGVKALKEGVALHHGDIPQESREIIESLLRKKHIKFAICTNTLAEGVNLPIRTLVIYSVNRLLPDGTRIPLLTRDIKNLVGRTGRAGTSTKGLVICANPNDWKFVRKVAIQAQEETVTGALYTLMHDLHNELKAKPAISLSNRLMEKVPKLHSLIDGVDSILLDMIAEELGTEQLQEIAIHLANETFAARKNGTNEHTLMKRVFILRAQRIAAIHAAGKLSWIRETGARARLLESIEKSLAPKIVSLDDNIEPRDPRLIEALVLWAWVHPEFIAELRKAYRIKQGDELSITPLSFAKLVSYWVNGYSFKDISTNLNLSIDILLNIHSAVLTYALQMLVEQGIAILGKLLESQGQNLSPAVKLFPELLRFGVPTGQASTLMQKGVRHRRAAVYLGSHNDLLAIPISTPALLFAKAQAVIAENRTGYQKLFGNLVLENTERDLRS